MVRTKYAENQKTVLASKLEILQQTYALLDVLNHKELLLIQLFHFFVFKDAPSTIVSFILLILLIDIVEIGVLLTILVII